MIVRAVALALVAATVAACTAPGSQVVDGPGLVGTYVVNGVDPLGVEYSGTVVIEPGESADEVRIGWLVTGAIQEGVGVIDGDALRVEWHTVEGARGVSTGSALYTIGEDGRLVGTRRVDGIDGEGSEEIFPRP